MDFPSKFQPQRKEDMDLRMEFENARCAHQCGKTGIKCNVKVPIQSRDLFGNRHWFTKDMPTHARWNKPMLFDTYTGLVCVSPNRENCSHFQPVDTHEL